MRYKRKLQNGLRFNPLDRGNLYQILITSIGNLWVALAFQSPRSGKFVSDNYLNNLDYRLKRRFNPLDRGNLYQMGKTYESKDIRLSTVFQSPRSGKFVSDRATMLSSKKR